jgi:DNA mismatch repair protein MutS
MSLFDDYEAYTLKYTAEYGHQTIVLYRCGGFYEIYSVEESWMKKVCDLLNIQMSRRNKNILQVNRSNTWMAGFPLYTLQKFVNILVENNYTVVIVDQISEAPKPKRAVTSIISPGTDVSNVKAADANNLASVYVFESIDFKSKKTLLSIGASVIDLSTGKCFVTEVASTTHDCSLAIDEIYRFLHAHHPREIVMFGNVTEDIISHLELRDKCVHIKTPVDNIFELVYQTKILEKAYPNHGMLSVIEFLDMERLPLATISFVYLLQFSFQHNELILNHIQNPTIVNHAKHLVLSYNCAQHLNIFNNGLLHLLNACRTPIGKRLFREWLLHPLIDANSIVMRHDAVDYLIQNKTFIMLEKHLSEIYDLERLCRRMDLKSFGPCDIHPVINSIVALQNIIDIVHSSPLEKCGRYNKSSLHDTLQNIVDYITHKIDLNEAQTNNPTRSFFKKGIYKTIDDLQERLDQTIGYFDALAQFFNKDFFKVDHNLIDGYHLIITSKRFEDSKKQLQKMEFDLHLVY